MKVEFLRAWSDHTWDLITSEVPDATIMDSCGGSYLPSVEWEHVLTEWAEEKLQVHPKEGQTVCLFAVYHIDLEIGVSGAA